MFAARAHGLHQERHVGLCQAVVAQRWNRKPPVTSRYANTAAFQGVSAMTETPLPSATYAVPAVGSTPIGAG